MKTIAVLINFSPRSEHAARYALQLAKKIKANVLLFNAFLVPADIAMSATQLAWPVDEYKEIKSDAEKGLHSLRNKLKHSFNEGAVTGPFVPAITCRCEEGPVENSLPILQQNEDIVLLVAGTHGSDAISTFALGNNCRELIDDTRLPLLLIPENAPIENIEKIVFATDLNPNDIKYINAVAGLADEFSAHIIIGNVNMELSVDVDHNKAENAFMQQMVLNVSYRRISYRNFPNQNVKKGLVWVLENEKPDMMVMVHRKNSLFDFLFKSSVTKKIAANTTVPLLVYPYPMDSVPAF
ncbi:nucleotide-binding universal stress UspA family protein [Mucilaginibacter frigoritolerans]|uniref:Nucleotide-binding universal stress UspA family protein n=1 Tax=Mucilaginibacter frigoritolerans TaxID=652788 RepID=A0A562TPR7_9SPHI|nr:universal stress protein [Mucilaginibacter frigoritolerans]TWI95581.1 nucleotide-binding universal stress UspA family protein [Mucilaginibacter frigoritolerans]